MDSDEDDMENNDNNDDDSDIEASCFEADDDDDDDEPWSLCAKKLTYSYSFTLFIIFWRKIWCNAFLKHPNDKLIAP